MYYKKKMKENEVEKRDESNDGLQDQEQIKMANNFLTKKYLKKKENTK